MWLKSLTHYFLKYPWLTLLVVFCISFVPLLGMIGILIAVLFTLRKNIKWGGLMTLAATIPYFIGLYFPNKNHSIPLAIWAAIGVAVISNLLTWIFAIMLKRRWSWSDILQTAALLGVLFISILHLIYPDIGEWWGYQLHRYYTQATAVTGLVQNKGVIGETQLDAINVTKQYATGFMVGALLFNAILQLVIARWWESFVFHYGILRRELRELRLSPLAGLLFILSLIFSYLGNAVVLDIMPIVCMLFCASGLSLIHYFFGLSKNSTTWFWLSLLYVTAILAMPTSLIIISMVALIDIWLDGRKRFRKV
jgi:hypothetical protein